MGQVFFVIDIDFDTELKLPRFVLFDIVLGLVVHLCFSLVRVFKRSNIEELTLQFKELELISGKACTLSSPCLVILGGISVLDDTKLSKLV